MQLAIVQPRGDSVALIAHHSALHQTFASQQLWLEDVSRFKPKEMEAGIAGVEQLLTQAYTMAYYYTTVEVAMEICTSGIPAAASGKGAASVKFCLCPPSSTQLGWQTNAGGQFRANVARLLGLPIGDVQAVVLLGVPNGTVAAAGRSDAAMFTLTEKVGKRSSEDRSSSAFLEEVPGGQVVYSKKHIAKVWTLEATALADARRALVDVRMGQKLRDKFEGKTAIEVQQEVARLEAEVGR
jgi:hypothetical protein